MVKKFHEWLRLREAGAPPAPAPAGGGGGGGGGQGGGMGVPGTPYPDGQKPSDSKALGNKGKLDNAGISGGPNVKKGAGGGAPGAAPAPPAK